MTRGEAFALWRDKIETYEQGMHGLEYRDKFCCLGVLCHLLKDELNLHTHIEDNSTFYDNNAGYLPPKVTQFMGISATGLLKDGHCLAVMNDQGKTFTEIKEYLYPEKFFTPIESGLNHD